MTVYLDLIFLLNALADYLALHATARLSGLPVSWRRLLPAALLGGTYGVLCALPPLQGAGTFFPQLLAAAGLVWLVFGRAGDFLRRFLLFFLLSCTMGGALMALVGLLESRGSLAGRLNWGTFLLAGGCCYLLLSVVFRGGARHALRRELTEGTVEYGGRRCAFTALLDTGHTLTDPATGEGVLVAHWAALEGLWTAEVRAHLCRLEELGPERTLAALAALEEGRWRLLPYRAVGVGGGLLLCFRADRAAIGGTEMQRLTVALSPTPVSDGGGYTALWGCGRGEEESHAA